MGRNIFQIRLSTLFVLMMLASMFLAANIVERRVSDNNMEYRVRGWPLEVSRRFDAFAKRQIVEHPQDDIIHLRRDFIGNPNFPISNWRLKRTVNIIVAISTCLLVVTVLERRARR